MKSFLLCLFLAFVFYNNVSSQVEARQGFVSINFGLSIPSGNYGSNNFDNPAAGFATTGSAFDITCGHLLTPKFGAIAMLRGLAHLVDVGTYSNGLANYLRSGYPSGSTTVNYWSNTYSSGGMMGGIYGSFPFKSKLTVEPKGLIGFTSATLPASTTEAFDDGRKWATFVQEQATAVAFSYLLGIGAKLDLTTKLCLFMNLDFNSAHPRWKSFRVIGIGHITDEVDIYYYDQDLKMGSFNISTGLGVRF